MGVIMGTAGYMSPEQARGKTADKRADIWAFGCVLFEMVTGRQAFQGELVSDVMASILKTDPDYVGLPQSIHPPVLTTRDPDRELGHFWPQVLPDGNTVIFTRYAAPLENSRVSALHLDTGEVVPLQEGVVFGRYVDTGHLLYVRFDTVWAAPFDLERLEFTGPEQPVQEGVFLALGDVHSSFDVSRNGTLAYIPSTALRELVWVDLEGNEEIVTDRRDSFRFPSLSPDGREIVYQLDPGPAEIWRYDIEWRSPELLVSGDTSKIQPLWAPDGRHIVYQVRRPCGTSTGTRRTTGSTRCCWKRLTTSTRPRFRRMDGFWSTAKPVRWTQKTWISGLCRSKTDSPSYSCELRSRNHMAWCLLPETSSPTSLTEKGGRRSSSNPFRRRAPITTSCPSMVGTIHSGPGTVEPSFLVRRRT